MTEISIIMPVYNAEKFLSETLDSILKQSFVEWELICIDDSSTDSTFDILNQYQRKDNRITILTNSNRKGAGYTRNRGIKEAKGKYLSFLDGDDIFDEDMLAAAFEHAEKNDVDIEMFNGKHVPSETIHNKLYMIHGEEYKERYCKRTFSVKEYEPYEFLNWTLAPWNKLYRREFIISNELEFQSLPCSNDVYFVSMALMLAKRIHVLDDKRVMVYVRDHFEPSRISYSRDPMCTYLALEKIATDLRNRGEMDNLYQHFYWSAYLNIRYAIIRTKSKEQAEEFYNFMQKDGVKKLKKLGEEYYEMADEYVKKGFRLFEEEPFESQWYKYENNLKIYLDKKKPLVKNLFDNLEKKGMSIGIWGAGENGYVLLEFCMHHNLKVEMVIDKNKEKQGKVLFGYRINSPEEGLEKIQAVIISSQFIYEDVKKDVEKSGKMIELIDINHMVSIT